MALQAVDQEQARMAGVRNQVRNVADTSVVLRLLVRLLGAGGAGLAALVGIAVAGCVVTGDPDAFAGLLGTVSFVCFGGLAAWCMLVILLPLMMAENCRQRRLARRSLAALSPRQREEVLVPLRQEPGFGSRAVVRRFMREFRVGGSELVASSAATRDGNELACAEPGAGGHGA